jgi:hypothetical protein
MTDEHSSTGEDWPPPAARLRGIVWRVEESIERREYLAAARACEEGFGLGGDQRLLRGLHHLAAAGFKVQCGHPERARRQLEHARHRLGEHPLVAKLEREIA